MSEIKHCVLSTTESLCPICLKKVQAENVLIGDDVYIKKSCPEHGDFMAVVWRGKPGYKEWNKETECTPPLTVLKEKSKGCPYDCGVCTEHKQQACCVLVEVTKGCNQKCAYCFASSGGNHKDPDSNEIISWFRYLIEISEKRPFNIQISGGEPTIREDLPNIIKAGKELGLPYIQLNTNGYRLAFDEDYVKRLKKAGLSAVFLQFDGTRELIYERLRGQKLLEVKEKAINNLIKHQIGTVLVPTIVPGVNTDNIGEIINFALQRLPVVRGIHFQPVSYFGRFPQAPEDKDRITLPEIIRKIEEQTFGKIKAENFGTLQSGCALCSFKGTFLYMEDGEIISTGGGNSSCCRCSQDKAAIIKARDFVLNRWAFRENSKSTAKTSEYDFSDLDKYIQRLQNFGFSLTGMAFQDAWNVDLERNKKCSVHVFDAEKMALIPFCSYNITDISGRSLYRR